jgi:hypothetical protein
MSTHLYLHRVRGAGLSSSLGHRNPPILVPRRYGALPCHKSNPKQVSDSSINTYSITNMFKWNDCAMCAMTNMPKHCTKCQTSDRVDQFHNTHFYKSPAPDTGKCWVNKFLPVCFNVFELTIFVLLASWDDHVMSPCGFLPCKENRWNEPFSCCNSWNRKPIRISNIPSCAERIARSRLYSYTYMCVETQVISFR